MARGDEGPVRRKVCQRILEWMIEMKRERERAMSSSAKIMCQTRVLRRRIFASFLWRTISVSGRLRFTLIAEVLSV